MPFFDIKLSSSEQRPVAAKTDSLELRLLAEAVRLHEEAQGGPLNEPQAEAVARAEDGDLEQRIITRARSLSVASSLANAFRQLRSALGLVVGIGVILAAIAGGTTAQVALSASFDGLVNFFWVLGSILGVHTLALLLWLAVILVKPGAVTGSSLGGIAFALGSRLSRWLHKEPLHMAAVRAFGLVYARTAIGRWTLSALSHGLWLAFLLGCLILVILILSIKQYSFAWETTILSERTYIALTRAVATLPEILGFTTPDSRQIAESHWPGEEASFGASREAWSGLLIGSIVVYGILPRLFLLIFCWLARWRAVTRFRLDTTLPGYRRLQTRLLPEVRSLGVVDPDTEPQSVPEKTVEDEEVLSLAAQGPVAIVGLEIDPPKTTWPPLNSIDWLDLGFIDTRSERHRALEQLKTVSVTPRLIVVICSVAVTPDRGTRSFIAELQQVSHVPVVLVLTEGQRLRQRGDGEQLQQRVEDWRRLAAAAQVADARVLEVDLDHLTENSRARLATALGCDETTRSPVRRIEQAFALMMTHVEHWSAEPSVEQQAELHKAIAQVYRGEQQTWRSLLQTQLQAGGNKTQQLKQSADRMVSLLPERLRRSPRWLAVGAFTGAMGCVAASTLIAPAAIAALPAWAGLGAAASLLLQPAATVESRDNGKPVTVDLSGAVSSAALFAILLELQGRDEATITRVIDRVAVEDDLPVIADREAARQWLDLLRQRFDRALMEEGAR